MSPGVPDNAAGPVYLDEQGTFQPVAAGYDPPDGDDHIATLLGYLERQRATFAWRVDGLDAAGLRATLGPSALTLGGMLKHLARFEDDMSTEWLLGESQVAPWNAVDWENDHAWDWRTAAGDSPATLYSGWRDAVARARARFAAALSPDPATGAPVRPLVLPPGSGPSVAYILINMIEEYARHNGQADLLREAIDGRVGHDPPA